MNDKSSTTCSQHESRSDRRLNCEWNSIDWDQAYAVVNRIQVRIAKAVVSENWNLVKRLQYLLANSFYAKAIAVKRITSNTGKRTAGVDKQLWDTDALKMKAIYELGKKGYKPKPLKRIYIEKPGKSNKRPLSIPTMKDRAMQALYLLTLEPIAETTGDRISFGFRKYRSTHDAMEYIFKLLSRKNAPQWIIEGDIKGCFDNISHQYLLETIPMDKTMLEKFISAGYVYKKKLFNSNNLGTPQGGIISPALANMTLDGMEDFIAKNFWINKHGKVDKKHHNSFQINLVRYADDFIIATNNEKKAYEIKTAIESFMMQRGLTLSVEKTSITHIDKGFDFLGWTFRKYNGKLIIKPSKKSINKVVNTISSIIKENKTSKQETLIRRLNYVITGWSNYHQPVCSKETFGQIDHLIFEMLWKWAKRRHPRKGHRWIKDKYWKVCGKRKWVFKDKNVVLKNMKDTPIVRHTPLILTKNAITDKEYFLKRQKASRIKRTIAYKGSAAAHYVESGLLNA